MGHGIAQVFAVHGHTVAIHDPVAEVLARVPERVRTNLRALGLAEAAADRITLESTLAGAVSTAHVVFEAAPEDLKLKQRIFWELAAATRPGCILASNTSVIPIAEISARVVDARQVIGTHWWNPPYLIPLVEVVQAARTEPACVDQMMDLLKRAGKSPPQQWRWPRARAHAAAGCR